MGTYSRSWPALNESRSPRDSYGRGVKTTVSPWQRIPSTGGQITGISECKWNLLEYRYLFNKLPLFLVKCLQTGIKTFQHHKVWYTKDQSSEDLDTRSLVGLSRSSIKVSQPIHQTHRGCRTSSFMLLLSQSHRLWENRWRDRETNRDKQHQS